MSPPTPTAYFLQDPVLKQMSLLSQLLRGIPQKSEPEFLRWAVQLVPGCLQF